MTAAGESPTVIKINAITVPEDAGDELARRFAARAHAVDDQEGFEGFELLRPTDDRRQWLVVTRWRDEASFQKWVVLAGLRARPRRGRPALAARRPGVGVVRTVVLRGGRRLGCRLTAEPGQRAGTIGRSPGAAASPAASISSCAWAPSSEMRSTNAMRM